MRLPEFTAEASVYKTSNTYRLSAHGGFLSNGDATVIPQGCSWLQSLACGALLASCGFCAKDIKCWLGCAGSAVFGCHDCLEKWGFDIAGLFDSGGGRRGGGTFAGGPLVRRQIY